jgi:glycerol dehydrogenase
MAVRIFGAPPRYIQGAGALSQLPALLGRLGRRPFIIADEGAGEALRQEIEQQLQASADRVIFGLAGALCSAAEIERFAGTARMLDADILAGLGGATAIGLAKGVALGMRLPLVTLPTLPCCHAAVSRLVEIEAEGEAPAETRAMPVPPDLVLVDTTLLAAAPPRQLIAGLGDALARKFEFEQGEHAGALNLIEGRPTLLAAAAAESAYRAIREHAIAALALRTRRESGEALERVAEAMLLLGGIAHESGGPSIAHVLARSFATLPACRTALHGELVAFALLAQLAFEERPAEPVAELVGFYRSLGLPVRLAEIGIVADADAAAEAVARHAAMGFLVPFDAKRLARAILEADAAAAK